LPCRPTSSRINVSRITTVHNRIFHVPRSLSRRPFSSDNGTAGAYTYARVPLGYWLQDLFSLSRNPYDRIGHFMQGFVPALAAREVLLRGGYIANRRMAAFLCLCVAMAVSAWYELIEWGAAVALGQAADDFLGTQGDTWDTQWDMFMCFIGAVTALQTLSGIHDRQIEKLN
jgi:putative membrane protein